MLEAALEGLAGVFQPQALALMAAGVLIGSVVGFLPGIGGPSTLAIMLGDDDEGPAARHRIFAFLFLTRSSIIEPAFPEVDGIVFSFTGSCRLSSESSKFNQPLPGIQRKDPNLG
jgi:hypothetical protein